MTYTTLTRLFTGIMAPTYDLYKVTGPNFTLRPMESLFAFFANRIMQEETESFIKAFEDKDWISAGHAVERAQVKIVNLAITYDVDMDKFSTPDGISLT